MSQKSDLKRAIIESEKEIAELERKCSRSKTSLLKAILDNSEISEKDAQYFRIYTSLIEVERENLRKLNDELKAL